MRRLEEKIEERKDYILFHKGEIAGHRGVGFLIKKSLKQHIHELIGISDRIAILNIDIPGYRKLWSVIQIYAPTEQASRRDTIHFYEELAKTLRNYSSNNILLMGDFNAQVGEKQCLEEHVLGNFGHGKRSPNGELLIELLLEHNLTLLNSLYKKNTKNKWTWISPDGKYKNEIDFMATNHKNAFSNISVLSRFNFNTNHRMLRSIMKLNVTKPPRKFIKPQKSEQFNEETLKIISEHIKKATKDLTIKEQNIDVLTKYGILEKQLNLAKPKNIKNNKYNLTNQTLQLIEERKKLLSNKPRKENLHLITKISKEIRENIRKDRNAIRQQTLENRIKRTGGVKKAFKELKEINKEWIPKLNDNSITGNKRPSTQRKHISEIATKFYEKLICK
ncbi:unnamed protein product [Colias eurytheme]|nr:unnamed protein product [Colias eurytheme]